MQNFIATLSEIADIRTGLFARPEPGGNLVYLQAKHFDETGCLQSGILTELRSEFVSGNHRLIAGDVLFSAKGYKNFAALYKGEFPAVASTTFFVSRLRTRDVLPEYLVWYLNSPATQELVKRGAIGSSIVSIPKSSFGQLEISVPPLEVQRKILEIDKLSRREHDLRRKIAELRRDMVRQQITKAIK